MLGLLEKVWSELSGLGIALVKSPVGESPVSPGTQKAVGKEQSDVDAGVS